MTIMKDIEGILVEVLSRLPVKSLLRFICVCRNWEALISTHYFRKVHRENHTTSPPLLIASYDDFDILNPPYDPNDDNLKTYLAILDLEGKFIEKITLPFPPGVTFAMTTTAYKSKLLCFYSVDHTDNLFYLYYPSTKKSFLLPKPPCFSSPDFERNYGTLLGYIPSKDEYIMVLLIKSNGRMYCEVLDNISISYDNYKLHYKRWRSSIGQATTIIGNISGLGVFAGGAFYWQAICVDNINNGFIISFHPETERFSNFNYPEDLEDIQAGLLELKDDLYLVKHSRKSQALLMWKLSTNDNKYKWTCFWKFDFNRLFGFTRGEYFGFRCSVFIYNLKYLKGYDEQPRDEEISVEMGEMRHKYKLPSNAGISAVHSLFTL